MRKTTLFDTAFGKASALNDQAKQALPFLSKNFKLIAISDDDIRTITSLNSIVTSPMDNLFHHILDAGKIDKYLLMEFTKIINSDLPEILTMGEISVDGSKIKASVPDHLKKIWINLTPIMNMRKTATGSIVINDLSKLQSQIVRGSLCMSYDAADTWLTPKLASFIIESYSITISALIKRTYNLDPLDTIFVQTLFAIYYAQLLGPQTGDFLNPPLLNRCTFLGSLNEINRTIEKTLPYRENNGNDLLTPDKICNILNEIGPGRMKGFTVNSLYRFISMGPMDSQSMMLAIDYPPYWVYQVLKTLSGSKNPILSTILKMRQLNKKADDFCMELNHSRYVESLGD